MSRPGIIVTAIAIAVVAAACSTTGSASQAPSADPTKDKLAQVLARGTLVLSTDTAYPPQSFAVDGATRDPATKCAANELTGSEVSGFDAETGKAVAAGLGVEPCFVVPTWTEITGGNWGDRWDISWGSGAINSDRMTRLYMTQPYYSTPQRFFVRSDSPYAAPADLAGQAIGVCASCTHEYYLKGELEIPGVDVTPKVTDASIVTYQAEPPGLQELADGKIEAFLCAEPVGQQAIADGLGLRALDEAAFPIFSTGFVDRKSGLAVEPFLDRINAIVRSLHADGTLKALSIRYFGVDYATDAGAFDLASIGQAVP